MVSDSISSSYVLPWNRGPPFQPLPRPCFLSHLLSRYDADTDNIAWPSKVQGFNKRFTKVLETIKTRHDPTVTTVAQGILEWKRLRNAQHIGLDMQTWLDRFHLSRIGIRFLIGQRKSYHPSSSHLTKLSSDVALNTRRLRRHHLHPSRTSSHLIPFSSLITSISSSHRLERS
jgi:Mitochondrial branched-chain alpha-ketoacid dehydrogenase kinase